MRLNVTLKSALLVEESKVDVESIMFTLSMLSEGGMFSLTEN